MATLAYMEWTYVMLFAMTDMYDGFLVCIPFIGTYLHMIFKFLMRTRRGSRAHVLPTTFIACMVIGLSIPF